MQIIETDNVPIKAWIDGVGVEDKAKQQLINTARFRSSFTTSP